MVVAMRRDNRFEPSSWRRLLAASLFVFGVFLPSTSDAHDGLAGRDATPTIVRFGSHDGRPRLGVGVVEMTSPLRRFFGAPADAGILVSQIEDDSPAKAGGIKVGDVIIQVAGEEIENVGDVHEALADEDDGEKVTVVVVRNKKKLRKKVKVEGGGSQSHSHSHGVVVPAPPQPPAPPFAPGAKTKLLEKELERTRKQLREIEKRLEKLEAKRRAGS